MHFAACAICTDGFAHSHGRESLTAAYARHRVAAICDRDQSAQEGPATVAIWATRGGVAQIIRCSEALSDT